MRARARSRYLSDLCSRRISCLGPAFLGLSLLAGCAGGDFGRLRPTFVTDDIHAWVGTEAARFGGEQSSRYPLTDDERLLRDLAYPLIEPPYDRNRWSAVIAEYGSARELLNDWWVIDRAAYSERLMSSYDRSASRRYAVLTDDIRNDIVRIDPFFVLARRVLGMDEKREKALGLVSALAPEERANALARIAENRCVIQWVYRSLLERVSAYRFALERLVIAEPSDAAAEIERVLIQLQGRIAQNHILPPLQIQAPKARLADGRRPDRVFK
jgi:hypothetical protein